MFWQESRQRPLRARRQKSRPRTRLSLETLEDRCLPTVTVAPPVINAVEGVPNVGLQVTTFTDSNTALTANQFLVSVSYGDGTLVSNIPGSPVFDPNLKVTGSAGNFTITDTGDPSVGPISVSVARDTFELQKTVEPPPNLVNAARG